MRIDLTLNPLPALKKQARYYGFDVITMTNNTFAITALKENLFNPFSMQILTLKELQSAIQFLAELPTPAKKFWANSKEAKNFDRKRKTFKFS